MDTVGAWDEYDEFVVDNITVIAGYSIIEQGEPLSSLEEFLNNKDNFINENKETKEFFSNFKLDTIIPLPSSITLKTFIKFIEKWEEQYDDIDVFYFKQYIDNIIQSKLMRTNIPKFIIIREHKGESETMSYIHSHAKSNNFITPPTIIKK